MPADEHPLHVLLKADHCLKGDVADDKADPLVRLQLKQIYVRQAPWTTTMCLDGLFFKFLATVVALFWQTGKGGEKQVIWCLRRPQMLDLCVSLQCGCLLLFGEIKKP